MIFSTMRVEYGGNAMRRGKWTKICMPFNRLQMCDIAPVSKTVVIAVPTKADVAVFPVLFTP